MYFENNSINFVVDPTLRCLFNTLSDDDFEELLGLSKVTILSFALKRAEWEAINFKTKPLSLSPLQEVILFLFYLRHYPIDNILACLLLCNKQTARNTRKRMLLWFYDELKEEIKVPAAEERLSNAVFLLGHYYTFIIDGSEQPTNASIHVLKEMKFYSAKKSQHSVNVLVVIDITGKVIWISKSYGGSFNDRHLVKEELKEFLKKITGMEFGFGDYGFDGMLEYQIAPQPNRNTLLFRVTNSYRIKVENTFARLKDWASVRETIRGTLGDELLEEHNMRWVIVSALINSYC